MYPSASSWRMWPRVLRLFVDAAGVVAGAEVAEAGGGVGEQVPDDDQDGAGDGDQGLELAAAFDEPPVAFAEEGVGAGGGGGGFAEVPLEVGVALAGLAAAAAGPGLDGARGQLRPRHQVPGGGEPAHVQPDLGDDRLRAVAADAGDLIQPVERRAAPAASWPVPGAGAGGAVGVDALGGGDGGDQLPRSGW